MGANPYSWYVFSRFYNSLLNFIFNNIYYGGEKFSINSSTESVKSQIYKPTVAASIKMIFIVFLSVFLSIFFAKITLSIGVFGAVLTFISGMMTYISFIMYGVYFNHLIKVYVWSRLKLQNFQISHSIKFSETIKIVFHNLFFMTITLGLYFPWARVKFKKYIIENKYIDMDDFESFSNDARESTSALGEEVASVFEFDFDIGI